MAIGRKALSDLIEAGEAEIEEDPDGDFAEQIRTLTERWNYSTRNLVAILMQCPEASHVRGFRQWAAEGRRIVQGEAGIGILIPCRYQGEDGETMVLRGFKVGYVFDVSQTEPIQAVVAA